MSLIYLQLLSKLVQDGWKNENYSSGWSAVSKDNRVLLFLTYLPKQPIPPLPLDAKLQRAEVFLFCPQGLNAQDLDQDVLRNIQSWFIDLQTGYVFPYPLIQSKKPGTGLCLILIRMTHLLRQILILQWKRLRIALPIQKNICLISLLALQR